MIRINKKIISRLMLVIIFATVFAAGTYVGVKAYSGTFFGRKQGYGYFENEKYKADGNGYVLSDGIKKTSVSSFISYLKDKNKKEDSQNGTGAAFIVYTMLGKSGKDRDRDIDGDDWDDLEERLRSLDNRGNIDWSETVSLKINSYHQKWTETKTKKGKTTKTTYHDDAFYSNSDSEKSIVFYDDDGKVLYALAHKCANPMGSVDKGLPEPNKWDVSVSSKVTKTGSLLPGDTVRWTHTVKNEGPDATDQDVEYRYENNSALGGGSGSDHDFDAGQKKNESESFNHTSRTINSNDAGTQWCSATSAKPRSWDNSNRITSSNACVTLLYKYTLDPFITSSQSGTIEANTSVTVTPSVRNNGPTRSRTTQWQISQIVVAPGSAIPHENTPGTSPQAPCVAYFVTAGASCSIVNNGTGTTVLSVGLSTLASRTVAAGDYEVGTKLCFAFSVQPRASSVPSNPGSDDQWANSAPVCMIIGKKPKVQVLGGDTMSGGIIQTSTSSKNISGTTRMFGSWDEYAALAVGSISGMGSGAAFAGPGMASSTVCKYSTLSFTNSGNSATCVANLSAGGGIGNYAIAQTMPGVAASFPVNATDPNRNLGNNPTIDLSIGDLQGIYRASGNVTINGGGAGKFINKSQWIVINAPTANVTINGDISYTNETLTTIDQIPQVIIIANNINIVDSVTNIDAWLVAGGYINTCSSINIAAPLSASICDDRLTVNGAVMAQKLYLRRTAGSGVGNASGDPAEVFNLRADAYLWSMARANSNGHVQTVDAIELPPRF
jgi:hypothetical protein